MRRSLDFLLCLMQNVVRLQARVAKRQLRMLELLASSSSPSRRTSTSRRRRRRRRKKR